jgi:Tol biopolymer transport system component
LIGKHLVHYEILEKIGEGGMGEVYRAHDTKLRRDVAIKVLPPELTENAERAARFAREARTLASLQHPNIASIYGFEDSGEVNFLVMEFVEGEDLAARLLRGPLAVDDAVEIAGKVALGLEAAHEQGIVHRDLKPANIRTGPSGEVKILDFGLARALAGDLEPDSDPSRSPTITAAMTQAGTILGTAAYMSPEQARGKRVDRRADIWAFGVVLYEMLTARRLFEGETVSDTLAGVLRAPIELDDVPTTIPPALRLLLARCLERDPQRRLRDIGEARVVLDALRTGDVSSSLLMSADQLMGSGESAHARARIRPREWVGWALALGALVALALLVPRLKGESASSKDPVRRVSIPLPAQADLRYSRGGMAISPDGTRIAYVDGQTLYLRDLGSWDPIAVTGSEGAATPFWSPDGEWVAYGLDRELWKAYKDGTQRSLICTADVPFAQVTGGAWLSDGRVVFRGKKDLETVPASGGSPKTFLSAKDNEAVDFHEPCAILGGKLVLIVVHEQEGPDTVASVDLDGKMQRICKIPDANLGAPRYSPSGHVLVMKETEMWAVQVNAGVDHATGDPFWVLRDVASPSLSDDGTLAYVRGAGKIRRQLVLVDREGKIQYRLGKPMNLWSTCALNEEGTLAVVQANGQNEDLWLHDRRGAMTRATFTKIEHDMPSFSPDGHMLYFSTGTQDSYRIARKSVEGNEPEETVIPAGDMSPHYYASCPILTENGKRLFYTAKGADGSQDIAWLDLEEGAKPKIFLATAAREYAARPAPQDPHYIAYVSDESGKDQVYLTTWPDAERKWSVSIEGGCWPHWKGDGSELYFALANEIYAVTVSYDPLELGRPRKLFSRPEYDDRQPFGWPASFDLTRDGKLFLTTDLVVEGELNPHIAIVENWQSTFTK